MNYLPFFSFLLMLLLTSCTDTKDANKHWHFSPVPHPGEAGASSRFYQNQAGDTWISWVAYLNDTTDALQYSPWEGDKWGAAMQISQGSDWFVNWADFPALSSFQNDPDRLVAHWLQKSAEGTYDYEIKYSISDEASLNWSAPQILHRDDTFPAEHGFLSFVSGANYVQAVWLDGRQAKEKGPMSLRTAKINAIGEVYDNVALDLRVCDCCATAATATEEGLLVAYRDRSEAEVRDISLVRETATGWSAPYQVHPDQWTIAGCPVNGPSMASMGSTVALAWFTGVGEKGTVYLSFSHDNGVSFGEKIQLNKASSPGRIASTFTPKGTLVVLWMENKDQEAILRMQEFSPDGTSWPAIDITPMRAARDSGFPQVVAIGNQLLVSYSAVDDEGLSSVITLLGTLKKMPEG